MRWWFVRALACCFVLFLFVGGCATDEPKASRCETCSGPGQCETGLACIESKCVTSGCKPTGNNAFSSCKNC